MPDADAHARYLETLTTAELQARAAALVEDGRKRETPQVEFWRPARPRLFGAVLSDEQKHLMVS